MRWESLFDDLEAQAEAAEQADLEAELRDRSRAERARLRMLDRLRAAQGRQLDVQLRDGGRVRGRLLRMGPDWLLLQPESDAETLVPLDAVVVVGGIGREAVEPGSEGALAARLDLRHVLRGIVRDRSRVSLCLEGGLTTSVVLRGVGADHVEIVEQDRSSDVRLVPLAALVVLRRLVS